jgi:hypothetical protein
MMEDYHRVIVLREDGYDEDVTPRSHHPRNGCRSQRSIARGLWESATIGGP